MRNSKRNRSNGGARLDLRLPLLALLIGACSGSAPERAAPDRAPSASAQSADERIARWTRERPGQPLQAAIAFQQLLPDSAIVQLLQRHRVQPYLVQVWAGGTGSYTQLPPEQADVRVIADARTQLLERLARNVCSAAQRVQRMLGDRAAARGRDTTRVTAARVMLSRLRAEEEALRQVRAGAAIVWAVYVTGAPEDVRALGADSLVWGFEPTEFANEEGQPLVGVPRPPEPKPVGEVTTYPDIERLSEQDVLAQLEQIAARPTANCAATAASETITGNWLVVARRDSRAVLMAQPGQRGAQRDGGRDAPAPRATLEAMIYAPDQPLQPASVQLVPLSLPGVPAERARPLNVGRIRLDGRDIFVSVPGHAPSLQTSPAAADTLVFAEANALWLLSPAGSVRRLTAERVSAFDYATLAARQREGEVILYWADAPVWSADGRYIAYVSNREAVLMNRPGQSVWLLDVVSGDEHSVLSEPGDSYYPHGWLGRELVFGGPPGIGAIDVSSGMRRQLAAGTFVAASADGGTIVVADNVPEATQLRLFTRTDTIEVPPAPRGTTYAAQAVFSPGNARLLLHAASPDGRRRSFFIFDIHARRLQPVDSAGQQLVDWPQWLDEHALLLNVYDASSGEARALIARITD